MCYESIDEAIQISIYVLGRALYSRVRMLSKAKLV